MALTHGGNIFAIARERAWDWRDVLDFSASTNPLGPSPRVRGAICRALDRLVHYPDREPVRLQAALARAWGVSAAQLLCGNGATELIAFLARACRETRTTLAVPVFAEFHRLFPQAFCVDLLHAEKWPAEGLMVVTRPANPTGWTLPLRVLENYLAASSALVIVDESFIEFTSAPSAVDLLEKYPRLVILRSLTKFYCLPGLRLGALIAAENRIREWRSLREPWQVNILAEEAGIAAIGDEEHAKTSLLVVDRERTWLLNNIRLLPKANPAQSDANYLFVRLDYSAEALASHLLEQKILVRNCTGWPGVPGEAIRIAVRMRPENERLIAAWKEFSCV